MWFGNGGVFGDDVLRARRKIVLLGWYGGENLGDEMLLSAMIRSFDRNGIEIEQVVVVSDDPVHTHELHGVSAIRFADFPSLVNLLGNTRVCVLGGGGLIKDGSCRRWLTRLLLFRVFGARTMCYAIGAAPLSRKLDVLLVRLVVGHLVDLITVRDSKSLDVLEKVGVRKDIVLSADPAVLYQDLNTRQGIRSILPPASRPLVGVCPKEYEHEDVDAIRSSIPRRSYIEKMATECDGLLVDSAGTMVMIACTAADAKDIHEIRDAMRCADRVIVLAHELNPTEFQVLISSLDILISQRLHPLIAASLTSVPVVAIPYSMKVRSYMEELGMSGFSVDYSKLGSGILKQKVNDLLREREKVRVRMRRSLIALQGRAQISIDLLGELAS